MILTFSGPCIRIGPGEVHIDGKADPSFWDLLYSHSNKLDKDAWYYHGFGAGLASVSTGPADLHRTRRGAMSGYFSTSNVRKYEPMILRQIEKFCGRLESCQVEKQVVNLTNASMCLATDVVSTFAVPEPRNFLASPNFGKDFNQLIRGFARLIAFNRHFPIVFPILSAIPDWLTIRMDSTGASLQMVEWQRSFERQSALAEEREGVPPDGQSPSILDAVVRSPELAKSDKKASRLVEEARNTVQAGTETTASTLTTVIYHALVNPDILGKLKEELHTAAAGSKDLIDYRTLERLPYLQACINETLRTRSPVTGRLPRVNPRAAMSYTDATGKTHTFPPGTVMSMSIPDLHSNPDIYPEPDLFKPERWIESKPEVKARMNQYFAPFGKGTRACIGLDLARMELVLAAGNLLNRYDFELFETTARDISYAENWFAPFPPRDSKGVRVLVQ